jgi:hypothetical protein
MKWLLLVCSIIWCSSTTCCAQGIATNNLELLQGIWAGNLNSESESLYKIINGNKSIGLSFARDSKLSDFYLNESFEGFQNYRYDEVDSINIKWLSEDGKYYTSIIDEGRIRKDGWVNIEYCIIPEYFANDGELMSINGGQLVEFDKIDQLPFDVLVNLYKRGKLDKRDYIKEYLQIEVLVIKSLKSKIYTRPNKQVKGQLQKDDVIIVLEESGKWIRIKCRDSETGWIRKTDAID